MSNIHEEITDDSQIHVAKGFTSAQNGYAMWKNEQNIQAWDSRNILPAILAIADSSLAPPTTNDGDIYILSNARGQLDIDTIAWQSGNTVRYTFAGSPDLSTYVIGDYLNAISATNILNNGSFIITNINVGSFYVDVTNIAIADNTEDEASGSPAVGTSTLSSWSGCDQNSWARYSVQVGKWFSVTPSVGALVYNNADGSYYQFGSTWGLFVPGGSTPNFATVLTSGTSTGGNPITSPDGKSTLYVTNGQMAGSYINGSAQSDIFANPTNAGFDFTNGTHGGGGYSSATESSLYHDIKLIFDAPIYNFNALTASTVVYLNSSKNLVSLAAGSSGQVLTLAGGLPSWAAPSTGLSGTGFVKISGTTISYDNSTYLTTSIAASTYAPINNPTFTGTVTLAADATSGLQAVTFQQFNAAVNGLQLKQTATVATNGALPTNTYLVGVITITATGTLTVDSYVVALNDYVLVKDEVTAANNGLYKCTIAGSIGVQAVLTRATDMNAASEFSGAFVPVSFQGTANKNSLWLCNPTGTVTIGTTAIPFTQLNGATDLIQGSGITISGNTVSITTAGVTNAMLSGSITDAKLNSSYVYADGTRALTGNWAAGAYYISASQIGVGTGTTTPTTTLHVVETSSNSPRGILLDQYTTGTTGARFTARKARGTFGTPTVITSGDAILSITASAHDGTNFVDAGKILFASSGNVSTGVIGSQMQFQTMTDAGALTTAVTIDKSQVVTFASHLIVEGVTSTGATGTGKFVFDTSPTLSNPLVGTQSHGDSSTKAASTAFVQDATGALVYLTAGDWTTTLNTPFQNITELVFALAANSRYIIQMCIHVGAGGSGGLKLAATIPTAATMYINGMAPATTTQSMILQKFNVSGTAASVGFLATILDGEVIVAGTITTGVNSGNFQVQAQSGTNGQTTTIFQEGTWMRIIKIA